MKEPGRIYGFDRLILPRNEATVWGRLCWMRLMWAFVKRNVPPSGDLMDVWLTEY